MRTFLVSCSRKRDFCDMGPEILIRGRRRFEAMAQPYSMDAVSSTVPGHREMEGREAKRPGCCSSECSGGSAAAAATVCPQATQGARVEGAGGAVSPEQPQVTQGLWLTESLEHMADTLLGTSSLGRRGTLQGIHSLIENTFIYLLFITHFIYFS